MKSIKKVSCILTAVFLCSACFSLPALTESEENLIDQIMAFRISLAPLSNEEALSRAQEKRASDQPAPSEQGSIIADTFLALEEYNYLYEANQSDPRVKETIMPQIEKLDSFYEAHKNEELSPWFLCIYGDAISCSLQFLPTGTAMKRGLLIKKFYLQALEKAPDMVYANMNAGQWFIQAPAIGGGSKVKAAGYFDTAYKNARTPAEKYYSALLYSQSKYEAGETEECDRLLAEAEAVVPGSKYIENIRKVNAAGSSIYYYVVHRKEVDKKIARRDIGK